MQLGQVTGSELGGCSHSPSPITLLLGRLRRGFLLHLDVMQADIRGGSGLQMGAATKQLRLDRGQGLVRGPEKWNKPEQPAQRRLSLQPGAGCDQLPFCSRALS